MSKGKNTSCTLFIHCFISECILDYLGSSQHFIAELCRTWTLLQSCSLSEAVFGGSERYYYSQSFKRLVLLYRSYPCFVVICLNSAE